MALQAFLSQALCRLNTPESLDLPTLVWTRGAAFPVCSLESRMKCPLCGSRRVALIFGLPKEPNRQIAGMPSR